MKLSSLAIPALCILWVLVCGLRWWITNPENIGQRRFFAIAAGLGAGMFWILGHLVKDVLFDRPASEQAIKSGQEIRIQGR